MQTLAAQIIVADHRWKGTQRPCTFRHEDKSAPCQSAAFIAVKFVEIPGALWCPASNTGDEITEIAQRRVKVHHHKPFCAPGLDVW